MLWAARNKIICCGSSSYSVRCASNSSERRCAVLGRAYLLPRQRRRPAARGVPLSLPTRRRPCFLSTAVAAGKSSATLRERFYMDVGIQECACPVPVQQAAATNKSGEKETNHQEGSTTIRPTTIDSPVSAGVDGTDSASGVFRTKKTQTSLAATTDPTQNNLLLLPRRPPPRLGSTALSESSPSSCWYTVTLDGRAIKTPMGNVLALPSSDFATAVAAEWNSCDLYIRPTQMPLMRLACTAIDQTAWNTPDYILQIMPYLHHDTVCYWADPQSSDDRILYARQQQQWKQIHDFWQNEFCVGDDDRQKIYTYAQVYGAQEGMLFVTKNNKQSLSLSTGGLPHSESFVLACTDWVRQLDAWHLASLHALCTETKSFLMSVAILLNKLDAESAVHAARVEEELQISHWGLVEGQHDYDRLNCSINVTAAALLVQHFLRNSTPR